MINRIFHTIVVFLVCCLAMANYGCRKMPEQYATINAKTEPATECVTDADCVAVKADCCGCFKGGKQVAVARTKVKEFNAMMAASCEGVVCAQFISNDQSCKKQVSCDSGRCQLKSR